jgi:hypothetical protein
MVQKLLGENFDNLAVGRLGQIFAFFKPKAIGIAD